MSGESLRELIIAPRRLLRWGFQGLAAAKRRQYDQAPAHTARHWVAV